MAQKNEKIEKNKINRSLNNPIMIVPIRCFSCGKLIADKFIPYHKLKSEGIPVNEVWKTIGIRKFCCKRMLASQQDVVEDLLQFIRLQ